MKHVRQIIFLISLLAGITAFAATTIPGGNVSGTWTVDGSPYLINVDITIPADQTPSIEPGVAVNFQSWNRLTVNSYPQYRRKWQCHNW